MPENILVCVAWPYANGSIHLGHVAGAYLPADIFGKSGRLTQKNSISQVFPSKEDLVHKWYLNTFSFKILDSGNRSPGKNFKPWPSSHLLVPPVRSLPSRCRHHLAQRLRRPRQAPGHGEPPNLTLAAGCRQHPAAERPVAAASVHAWKQTSQLRGSV